MLLETQRLVIRELTLEDAPFFFELVNDPDWIRFIGDRNVQTVDDAKDYLQNRIFKSYEESGFGFYAVVLKSSNEVMGISGFVKRDELEHVDVGFAFLPKGRGKGYAFESTEALMNYGVKTFNFQKVLAIANNDNEPSHHLLKKLGFTFEKYVKLHDEEDEISLFSFINAAMG
jgi:RimJ/RimL family protein N-acetyltransferase